MNERIEFVAVIPDLGSAITIDGEEGAGGRLKLDIPGTDIAPLLRLIAWRGRLLRITVEVAQALGEQEEKQ